MFASLPETLRQYGVHADVRTLLLLRKSISKGLVSTFGDLYQVLRAIVVKHPSMMGPFTKAYYLYFLNIDIRNGETLSDAVKRSETFREWLDSKYGVQFRPSDEEIEELVDLFLSEVHLSSFDIKQIIDGEELMKKDDSSMEDGDDGDLTPRERLIEKMADYSNMSIEELMERMKEVAKQQRTRHSGGSHWIGTDGISPYGHGGAAKGGIRMGGTGGGKMARAVFNDSRYFPIDVDERLSDNNIDAALSTLKGTLEESSEEILDVDLTIKGGLKKGGIFLPEFKDKIDEKMQIILMIDNGGYSMDPYIRVVRRLFRKMKTRFAHDLKVFYFHNTIYNRVYTDSARSKYIDMDRFLKHDPLYSVFVIGDAAMAPWELDENSIINWGRIQEKFKRTVWLNPEPQQNWNYIMTIMYLSRIIPMFPLSIRGIEAAILHMNKKRRNN